MNESAAPAAPKAAPVEGLRSLVEQMAIDYSQPVDEFKKALNETCLRPEWDGEKSRPFSDGERQAFLHVCKRYGLDPLLGQVHAFRRKEGGLQVVVGVDGWIQIMNASPQFSGMRFEYGPEVSHAYRKKRWEGRKFDGWEDAQVGSFEWIEVQLFRVGFEQPICVREYFSECFVSGKSPWLSHPRRMLRHKALIQAIRVAFGVAGIVDPDEAERIRDAESARVAEAESEETAASAEALRSAAAGEDALVVIDDRPPSGPGSGRAANSPEAAKAAADLQRALARGGEAAEAGREAKDSEDPFEAQVRASSFRQADPRTLGARIQANLDQLPGVKIEEVWAKAGLKAASPDRLSREEKIRVAEAIRQVANPG